MRLEFKCPVCGGSRWGTDATSADVTGHCNTPGCGFTWPRAADFRFFRRIERATSRAEFERWRDTERLGWQSALNGAVRT